MRERIAPAARARRWARAGLWLGLAGCGGAAAAPRAPGAALARAEPAPLAATAPAPSPPPLTGPGAAPAGNSAAATGAPPEPAPARAGAAPGTSPEPAPARDGSLELRAYRAAGLPEEDRAWTPADYERCLRALASVVRGGGRAELPRHGSARSGALFARLVAPENFRGGAAASAERARELQRHLELFPGLLQLYAPASDGLDFSGEQTELVVALLTLLNSALSSSRELAAADPGWAEPYQRQKAMTVGVVRGLASMLAEQGRYPPPERQRLRSELARLSPELEVHLAPADVELVRSVARR